MNVVVHLDVSQALEKYKDERKKINAVDRRKITPGARKNVNRVKEARKRSLQFVYLNYQVRGTE